MLGAGWVIALGAAFLGNSAVALGEPSTASTPAGTPGTPPAEPGLRRAVIAGPAEPDLMARIRGQTSDLDWVFVWMEHDPALDVLAWSRGVEADAIVVIERRGVAWDVSLVGEARERRLVRRVEVSDPSSAREMVAVIVRGLLQAREVGAPVTLDPRGPGLVPFVALGLEGAWAGTALPAARGRVGVWLAPWTLAIGVVSGPARALDDGRTTLSLARHAASVHAGAQVEVGDAWTVGGALGVGAVGFWRSVAVRDPTLVATAPRLLPSLLVSAEAHLLWRPGGGPLGVELAAGLDVAPGAPTLSYELGGAVVERTEVAVLQPRVSVSISLTRSAQ